MFTCHRQPIITSPVTWRCTPENKSRCQGADKRPEHETGRTLPVEVQFSLCSVFSEGILEWTIYTWRWNLSSKGEKTTGKASYCDLQLGKSEESTKSKHHPSIQLCVLD
ncbi:hypothetical protein CRENBAI_020419 [Crenichthys baileyi]|uniref:Uncharacterized protein n=1 Tax=Crenichthys baileyi TaxID=28760 RepID=A0AAV9SAC1_9TELE